MMLSTVNTKHGPHFRQKTNAEATRKRRRPITWRRQTDQRDAGASPGKKMWGGHAWRVHVNTDNICISGYQKADDIANAFQKHCLLYTSDAADE